jgi:hypothetical protein
MFGRPAVARYRPGTTRTDSKPGAVQMLDGEYTTVIVYSQIFLKKTWDGQRRSNDVSMSALRWTGRSRQ